MTSPPIDGKIGYKRPPSKTSWRKGQSGNPKGPKRKTAETMVAMIDRMLLTAIPITLNGQKKRATTLEVILFQLLQKAKAGDRGAWRALLKYRGFANRHSEKKLEIAFVESDYTQALAEKSSGDTNA